MGMSKAQLTALRRQTLIRIIISIFLYLLTIGILAPIGPELVNMYVHDASVASSYWGVVVAVNGLVSFVCSPVLGTMSDAIGRKPVLILGCISLFLDNLLGGVSPSLVGFLIGRVVSGTMSNPVAIGAACIADVSAPHEKAQNLALIGVSFGLAFVFGPILGGFLGTYSVRIPFYVCTLLSLINMLFVMAALPETNTPRFTSPVTDEEDEEDDALDDEDDDETKEESLEEQYSARTTLVNHSKRAYAAYKTVQNPVTQLAALRGQALIWALSVVILLDHLGRQCWSSTWVLYVEHRFNWRSLEVGLSMAELGICGIFVQGFLIRRWIPWMGERKLISVGLTAGCVGLALLAFAFQAWILFAAVPIACLSSVVLPTATGTISNLVAIDQQGAIIGALASLETLTRVVGSLFATNIFAYFISSHSHIYLPGGALLLASLFYAIALLLAHFVFSHTITHAYATPSPEPIEEND